MTSELEAEDLAYNTGRADEREASAREWSGRLDRASTEIEKLKGALRAIIAHWDEFGPEHGFSETIDCERHHISADWL